MPIINGRYYSNPAYGRVVERARLAEQSHEAGEELNGHWVTIDHHHIFIRDSESQDGQHHERGGPHSLSPRDKAYLDKYYDAVLPLAKKYGVDPALALGVGIESDFASAGTYLRTGDAFGMTGGSTKHMTTALSAADNAKQFFEQYGAQIQGAGADVSAFVYGLEGRGREGSRVPGWKVYNTVNPNWSEFIRGGIRQMRRDIPRYRAESRGVK